MHAEMLSDRFHRVITAEMSQRHDAVPVLAARVVMRIQSGCNQGVGGATPIMAE
jgi:hypothetical protein